MFNKTMLTYRTLDRFEREYRTNSYTETEISKIEHAAYVANMNKTANHNWGENEIFTDFLRVLGLHGIEAEETTDTSNDVGIIIPLF